jgi:hypothetical protein
MGSKDLSSHGEVARLVRLESCFFGGVKVKRKRKLKIALKLKGLKSEKGFIRLEDLMRELSALREALSVIEKEETGKRMIYYRVIGLSQNSPAKIVIEPVLKPRFKTPKLGSRYEHIPGQIHHSFFRTMDLIRKDETEQLKAGEPVIDAIAELLEGLGSQFESGEIANSSKRFKLNDSFRHKIEDLLRPQYKSHGSIEGELLGMNVARGLRFYIYPETGGRSISCRFPEWLYAKAHSYIRKSVRVYGTKCFRHDASYPFKIVDIEDIRLLDPTQPFPSFVPMRSEVQKPNADELVRESREEWE